MDRRVAIVTGAGRGIGEATARALAREGFAIGCAGKHRDAVERVARSIVFLALDPLLTGANLPIFSNA